MIVKRYQIKQATSEQAEGICDVLIHSIKEVCVLDHHNDPNLLRSWLSNKTPDNIRKWIQDPSNYSLSALNQNGHVIGISMINTRGEILLNYLLKDFLYQGIGKEMLKEMENFAKKQNNKIIVVTSTVTACSFYERNGFIRRQVSSQNNEQITEIELCKIID